MKKIIVEFQDGKILPALLTEAEELVFKYVRPWRKVMVDLNPEHIAKLTFSRFKDLKFWERVRLLFWKDHYPDPPEPAVDPVEMFFDYMGAFRQ